MTNEEKAESIKINQPLVLLNPNYGTMIEYGALEMAKWKDQQLKEYLEKKRELYYQKTKSNDIETLNKIQCLNEVINELFKKE